MRNDNDNKRAGLTPCSLLNKLISLPVCSFLHAACIRPHNRQGALFPQACLRRLSMSSLSFIPMLLSVFCIRRSIRVSSFRGQGSPILPGTWGRPHLHQPSAGRAPLRQSCRLRPVTAGAAPVSVLQDPTGSFPRCQHFPGHHQSPSTRISRQVLPSHLNHRYPHTDIPLL